MKTIKVTNVEYKSECNWCGSDQLYQMKTIGQIQLPIQLDSQFGMMYYCKGCGRITHESQLTELSIGDSQ